MNVPCRGSELVGGALADELVRTFQRARFNGGERVRTPATRDRGARAGSEAGGRLMERPISVQSWLVLFRAEAGLGLGGSLLLGGAAALAGVR